MITQLEVHRPLPLTSLDSAELGVQIESVLTGQLPGFVLSAAMTNAFEQSIKHARNIGLEGGVNTSSMTFDYDETASGLLTARAAGLTPGPEDWGRYGITSLHADGEEGDEMLSVSRATLGAYTINILQRGINRQSDMPIELWDTLQIENTRLLLDGVVDMKNLLPNMTSLDVQAGDTVIFNPSNPHMGVTTQAPRIAETTFFYRTSQST
ncbi:hypothetical protein H7097_00670 [Aeromicrobium sp.]|nr:hypothetical protein [Candidatus Saccharibacteria bacterium]